MSHPRNTLKQYLGPGVWLDQANGVHYSAPDILAHLQLEDTEEHRQIVLQVVRELTLQHTPHANIIYRHTPDE